MYYCPPGIGIGVDIGCSSVSKMLKFYIKAFYVLDKALGELSCKQTGDVEILQT